MKKLLYLLTVILLTSCGSREDLDLDVMSFNIRYNNPEDSLNNWMYRKDIVAQIIKQQDIDILGAQEVLVDQLNDMKVSLPEYSFVGVGREDGKDKGEFGPVIFKKDRFKEIKSGYFWLSETPEVAGSKGWDGACERIATWVILEDNTTKRQVFFINTHLDHIGVIARQEGVTLLLNKTAELAGSLPVIMTGDFNATPDSDVIKHVIDESNPKHLIHTKDIASSSKGTQWTFHDFNRLPTDKRSFIDYIFVGQSVKVLKHIVLDESLDGKLLSDHTPVVAKIVIE